MVGGWPEAAPLLPPLPAPALVVASFGFCWLALWRGGVRLLGVPIIAGALWAGMTAPPPDILVSADGRLVAFRTASGVFLHEQPGATAFARQALLRRLGAEAAQRLPPEGVAAAGAIACTAQSCRFRPRPDAAEALLFRTAPPARGERRGTPVEPALVAAACGQVVLLIATEPLRPRCDASAVVDRFGLWRNGAQAAWLGAEARVVSDRAWRGDRPWVPPMPLPGRPEALPLAPAE
jgi:competence protein ComEC